MLNAVKGSQFVAFLFLLYSKNADLNTHDYTGNTALHIAAFNNSKSFLELLLVHTKVDINAVDNNNVTPLMRAIYSSAYNAVKILLRFNPDITIPNDKGVAPKEYAKRYFKDSDGIYSKILPAIERHQVQQVVDEIDSFETFKEQYRCSFMFFKLLFRRFFFGKKQAVWEYILFIILTCLFGDFAQEMKNSESLFHFILFHLSLLLSLISFIFFILASRKFQKQQQNCRTSIHERTPHNIVHHILQLVDDGKLSQIPSQDRVCFTCLSMKQQHSQHCKRCERCVKRFHKHSKWTDTCVGGHNARSYYFFLLFNFISNFYLVTAFFHVPLRDNIAPSNAWLGSLLQRFLEFVIYRGYGFFLLLFALYSIILVHSFQQFLWMNEAVINDMTVRELKKMWLYKYNFQIEIDEKTEQTYFAHRRSDILQSICNFCNFLKGQQTVRMSWNSPREPDSARRKPKTKTISLEEQLGEEGISESPMFHPEFKHDLSHDMTYQMDMEERTGSARLELSSKSKFKPNQVKPSTKYYELSSNLEHLDRI